MASILSFMTVILCAVALSEGCSCVTTDHWEILCRDQFAVQAEVRKRIGEKAIKAEARGLTDPDSEKEYEVTIWKKFKGSDRIVTRPFRSGRNPDVHIEERTNVLTRIGGCGIDLQKGEYYLLTGKIDGESLYINRCGWNVPWASLSAEDLIALAGFSTANNCSSS
ncbi:metalloproteinase inhibitor 1-like [Stylophora pistillata]|uniref:Metalloproteinase inhibitor 1 n=1 Tax=Stylophora pistillata TaxID=50429 RepID=A0A2B4SZ08_STYPI|nr:metalloproteinase inhibitor 1-like [Stylophora pistillata]PFX34323.1 Metalloproteinase inhibitor 1 [Stylophora pistillata]